jgi:hypothetical protein
MSLSERHRCASRRKSAVRPHGAVQRANRIAASLQNQLALGGREPHALCRALSEMSTVEKKNSEG